MARELISTNHAFTALMWSNSQLWFEVVYVAGMASAALLALGWRTRTTSLLFMLGVLSLQNRSPLMGDGGDNIVHVMAVCLVFTRCGQVWSLDARRTAADREDGGGRPDVIGIGMWAFFTVALAFVTALGKLSTGWALLLWGFLFAQAAWWLVRRCAPGEPRAVMEMMGNVLHAGALLVIAVEVCLVYSTAGWYKIQGALWQEGTALYYPFHLAFFTPWPALSHAIASSSLLVLLLTYGTVMAEVAFPLVLFNKWTRVAVVALMMTMHAGIGILLGLPLFALAMMSADALFLPTAFLRRVGHRVSRGVTALVGPD
ncbi:HTTM domain-containing protein [Streptomyces sp. NPDC046805]|uniref:HTTM domain-containing protein n=1 Tax=Streptomyces sp. NPDC046805 TaxID=3155134 RepID=UPI0033C17A79